MRSLKPILFVALVAVMTGSVSAQSDPKLTSDVKSELIPDSVTLSRDLFTGLAAWRVKLANNAANELNDVVFTAKTVVVDENGNPTGAVAAFDGTVGGVGSAVIQVLGVNPGCAVVAPTELRCTFDATTGTLPSGHGTQFIVVAKTPTSGHRMKLVWSFGGEEGNGNGNGCCTKMDETLYTSLIDEEAFDSTVKTHVQSFVVKGVLNKAFTGLTDGPPTAADPWRTVATLGNVYSVNGLPQQTYTQIVINEQDTSATLGSCSAIQNNKCWVSQVAIPNTEWTTKNPLEIRLDRHSSIIKKGARISNYLVEYKGDSAPDFQILQQCTPLGPGADMPCLDGACVEIALPGKPATFVWSCNIKARKNGFYRIN